MSDTTPAAFGSTAPSTATIGGLFTLLLKQPSEVIEATEGERLEIAARLFAGSALCLAAYGAAVGIFGGGWQVAVALVKVPLVVFATLLLCLPSFFVFASLAGSRYSLRKTFTLLLAFGGMLALLLAGFLPITWLFSVSTRSTTFLVWMNFLLWICAVGGAARFLRLAFAELPAGRRTIVFWSILVILVSLQMTTHLRPILWEQGDPMFAIEKMSFFEHLSTLR